ncbi:MAG: methylamine utilization protein [Planctomycetota bacterium]
MRHSTTKTLASLVASSLFILSPNVATAEKTETATLKMRFVYGDDVPTLSSSEGQENATGSSNTISNPRLMIDPESKGIRSVAVYAFTGRGGSKFKRDPSVKVKRQLVAENGQLQPRIVLARAGDTLEVTNKDGTGYNLNFGFFANRGMNLVLPPGGQKATSIALSEPAPIEIACNIRASTNAHVIVLDHPFAAISDQDGKIRIDGLPVGSEVVFKVYHELASIERVNLKGTSVEWKRSRFGIELSPGVNDLGDVVVSGKSFVD